MTIDEVLQNITILKDCTSVNLGAAILTGLGFFCVLVNIVIFIIKFSDSFLGEKIRIIIVTVLCILYVIFFGWFYMERPAFIDFYISANDVEIQQITKYFKVSEINETDDTLVCHIEPKSEFYDDLITYWIELEH